MGPQMRGELFGNARTRGEPSGGPISALGSGIELLADETLGGGCRRPRFFGDAWGLAPGVRCSAST
jgi:hypothetical protein